MDHQLPTKIEFQLDKDWLPGHVFPLIDVFGAAACDDATSRNDVTRSIFIKIHSLGSI